MSKTMDENDNPNAQAQRFDRVTAKGKEDGLFQACMKALRQPHATGNRLRLVVVVAGLFTDKTIYREVISCFYLLTRQLESSLEKRKDDPICEKLLKLGYHFTPHYEEDLKFLYDDPAHWSDKVESVAKNNTTVAAYLKKIDKACEDGDASSLAGAAFVLWGALIIGGGAVAKPKIESAYGAKATHLFQDVTGPGREARKRAFIDTWDSLAPNESSSFRDIVDASQNFMEDNNRIMSSISGRPWWLSYVKAGSVAIVALLVYQLFGERFLCFR